MISPLAKVDVSAVIGVDTRIDDGAVVGPGVHIGKGVHVAAGSVILGPCTIEDGCVIAAGCTLDPSADKTDGVLAIESGVALMAGTIIASRVRISVGACVRPGTVVNRAIPPHAIVEGNPAQIVGYTLSSPLDIARPAVPPQRIGVCESNVAGVGLHRLPKIFDLRGNLTVGEFERSIPFPAKRYFIVFDVPNAEIRGEHAHRICHQFLICARGNCSVVADDGTSREEFLLNDPSIGLHLPPLTWGIQYKYSADAVLLVFASEYYDSAEYIRDYSEFLELSAQARGNR